MKKYATWEMIKALAENPKLKFRDTSGIEIFINGNGYLHGKYCGLEGINGNIPINYEWELVQQPVSFMEVLKTDKRVRVEHELLSDKWYEIYHSLDVILYNAASDISSLSTIISEGKWYIKED